MVVLLELEGARLILDGALSLTQEARARQAWARVARFVAPTLRELIAEARAAEDTPPVYSALGAEALGGPGRRL